MINKALGLIGDRRELFLGNYLCSNMDNDIPAHPAAPPEVFRKTTNPYIVSDGTYHPLQSLSNMCY